MTKRSREVDSVQRSRKAPRVSHVAHQCTHDGCSFSAQRRSDLERHVRTHTGEKPFRCPHRGCTYASTQKGNLKTHLRTHTGEKPFRCDHPGCNYSGKEKGRLNIHKRIHTGEKPYKCKLCEYASSTSTNLKIHESKHSSTPRKNKSKRSGDKRSGDKRSGDERSGDKRSGDERSGDERSGDERSDDKPFQCGSCESSYSTKHSLKAHIRTKHPNLATKDPYKCDRCDISCATRGALKRHAIATHSEKGTGLEKYRRGNHPRWEEWFPSRPERDRTFVANAWIVS